MRKLLLTLGCLLSLYAPAGAQPTIIGPANAIICNQIANIAVGVTGVQLAVAGAANKIIVFCGWHITNTAAAGTFSISFGQGATCATNPVVLVTPQSVTSTAPSTDHVSAATASTPQVATGYGLCVNPSVATIAATLYYAQF